MRRTIAIATRRCDLPPFRLLLLLRPPPPLLLLWLLAAAPAVAAAPTRGAANEVSGVAFEAVVFCQEAADTGLEEGDKHL
jgi:hypothetical protein